MLRLEIPNCNFGTGFGSRLAFHALPPVLVVGGYVVVFAVVRVLSIGRIAPPMTVDSTFNAAGMLLQTLYVFLCKESLGYLVAQAHPDAPDTLALYPDVLVGGSTHLSMLWLGVITILVYVVGM